MNDAPEGGKNSDGTVDPAFNAATGRYEITTPEDTPISGRVKAYDVDGDPLTFSKGTNPANGTVTVNPDGTYTYTPNKDFNGTDSFTYQASDGSLATAPATVSITVNALNDPATGTLTLSGRAGQGLALTATPNIADVEEIGRAHV